jgi:L-serine dehydratase
MTISVFDLFTVGIGPSSSHTVGPMRAAARFVEDLRSLGALSLVAGVRVDLYGSLAATGAGHGTQPAILLGLEGHRPETIQTEEKESRLRQLRAGGQVLLGGLTPVALGEDDMVLHPRMVLDLHPNGMTITASGTDGKTIHAQTYFSIGGGFVVTEAEATATATDGSTGSGTAPSFSSAAELLELAEREGISISQVMLGHETATRPAQDVPKRLLQIRDVMVECERRGITRTGLLPGRLNVRRRAGGWYRRLQAEDPDRAPEFAEDWVNLVALAVNEENASGGRVVTAPTNGAAGIIPAVLHYAAHYTAAGKADPDDVAIRFLLTAGAIGSLYKERASISGAEVGCQGEVGSAASMAAGGLAEILGGTPRQVENAAEIAMEHSLGLTCDPIGGLVQIPCIERNAISAGKAINAARMALRGDGTHRVSLDEAIDTMRATGRDMSAKYKETSTGGLAVNVAVNYIEC